MKFSDFFCDFLSALGVKHVFGVTGGSVLHLLSSAEKSSKLEVTYTHHEQSAALAAVNYSRIISAGGACFVTTGPGGTNAVTGLASAWLDSIPAIFVSGQARERDVAALRFVRQVSSQHLDIVSVVRPLTKWAECLTGSWEEIAEHLASLKQCFLTNRPGPVWVDIPLDLQQKKVNESAFHLLCRPLMSTWVGDDPPAVNFDIGTINEALNAAKRPLFIIGGGAVLAQKARSLVAIAENRAIPYVTTWPAFGVAPSSHPLNLGVVGISGTRDANLACYLSDLVIAFGSSLSKQVTGDDLAEFAPGASVYILNIDPAESYRFVDNRYVYCCVDLRHVGDNSLDFAVMREFEWGYTPHLLKDLRNRGIKEEMGRQISQKDVDQYEFLREFSSALQPGDIVVIDGGGNVLFSSYQHLLLGDQNRAVNGSSIGCMGSGLPEAIGAAYATGKRVYCLVGDGSLQFNVQELETIRYHDLNIIIIVINNQGYKAIVDSQEAYFDHYFGVSEASGLSLPNWESIVRAYDLPYSRIASPESVRGIGRWLSTWQSPSVIEVVVPRETPLLPRGGFREREGVGRVRRAPWDMFPDVDLSTIYDFSLPDAAVEKFGPWGWRLDRNFGLE